MNEELYQQWATLAHDVQIQCCVKATQTSADYILEHAPFARSFVGSQTTGFGEDVEGRDQLLKFALGAAKAGGLVMEFGVFSGSSINVIAAEVDGACHGFDSFQGLPEDWKAESLKGEFSRGGEPPKVRANVQLHVGWFEDTLPGFVSAHPGHVTLIHMDCDLYSSTQTVLRALRERLVAGSVIVFDEFFNFPGWERHEARAWREFVEEFGVQYETIGYAARHYSLAVRVTGFA